MSFFSKLFGKTNRTHDAAGAQSPSSISTELPLETRDSASTIATNTLIKKDYSKLADNAIANLPSHYQPTFDIINVVYDPPFPNSLEMGETLEITMTYESPSECRIWAMPYSDHVGGSYESSDLEPKGRHTVTRWIKINEAVTPVFDAIQIIAKTDEGEHLDAQIFEVNYTLVPSSNDKYNEKQADGVGNTTVDIDKVRIYHEGVRVEEGATLPTHADIVVEVPYTTAAKYGIRVWVNANSQLESTYESSQLYQKRRDTAKQSFCIQEIGEVLGCEITISNDTGVNLLTHQLAFPMSFIDTRGDGKDNASIILAGMFINDDDRIEADDCIVEDSSVDVFIKYRHQAQHGVIVYVHEVIDGNIGEVLCESILLKEQVDDSLELGIEFEEVKELSGFYVVMKNTAYEVIAEQLLELPITIVPSEEDEED